MAALRPQQRDAAAALTGDEIVEVTQRSATVTITAATISAAASDNSFNDSGAGFLAAGFAPGMGVESSGFTGSAGNNSDECVIVSVTAGKMVVSGVTLVDDAAGESVSITQLVTRRSTAQEIADLVTGFATEAYVDAAIAGLSWKQSVRAATTAAVTLASDLENGDTLDGVTLATGDRILVKNQASPTENGIYIVAASGAPTRASDANSGAELVNATVYVSEGTTLADTQWTCSTDAPITIGATNIVFAQLSAGASDASAVTYTPTTAADWDGSADPGNVDGALDQLAERVTDLETGGAGGTAGKHSIPIMAGGMLPSISGGAGAHSGVASGSNLPDIWYLAFPDAADRYAQFAIPMPKKWDEGTVTFKPIWSHSSTATNFTVVWSLQAVAIGNDDTIAASYGAAQTSTDTGGTTDDLYVGPESSAITIAGTPAAEDVVFFRLARLGTDGSDNLAVDARLHGIILYYTTNAETDA